MYFHQSQNFLEIQVDKQLDGNFKGTNIIGRLSAISTRETTFVISYLLCCISVFF